jgi:hypothetical protein
MNQKIICRLLYFIDNNFMRYSYLVTTLNVNHLDTHTKLNKK